MNYSVVPSDLREIESAMSNFDHSIEPWAEKRLKTELVWARYAGWEFNGRVWWDRSRSVFRCEVWRYGSPGAVVEAASLEDLMNAVSERFGVK